MNKQTLWFVTLFSLILVLGVYYITLPNELLKSKDILEKTNGEISTDIKNEDMFVSLRVERDEEIADMMNELESKLTSASTSAEEKNSAFEELKVLNLVKGKEDFLEEKINNKLKIKAFVEIKDDQIKVVISSKEHNSSLANDIMRLVQEEYTEKMYITVKFE